MKKIALMSLVASSILMAGGYKIPEVSLNGVALSAANVAHVNGADAAYYNPANMVFMDNEDVISLDLTYISLDAPNYKGSVTLNGTALGTHDINAQSETFLVPTIHYVSSLSNGARFGLSIFSPGGLSKRWKNSVATYSAEEFTLQTVEVNPTVALPFGDKFGVALGLRLIHSKGIVKSTSPSSSRDMKGESTDFGYNIALSYKPTSEWDIGMTYRSQVDLTTSGTADLTLTTTTAVGPYPAGTRPPYSGDATVTVPLPALFNLAIAHTFSSKTTLEFVYERNFWSAYKELDFNYQGAIDPVVNGAFGAPITKDWKDTNAFRLGLTQGMGNAIIMAGVVYDETPVPDSTLSFELPDSNSISVSLGGRYQINRSLNAGLAALYSMREKRTVKNDSLDGEFSNSNVLMVSAGVEYKF